MKKIITLFTLTILTYSASLAQISMDEFKKQFKGKSLEEIKTILVDQNKQLASMIKLSSLSIKITAGKIDGSESKTTQGFNAEPKQKIIEAFNKKLNNLYFSTGIIYPNTVLGFDFSSSSLKYSVKDYDDYKFPDPTLKLKKVFFKNGKTANYNQNIGGRSTEEPDEVKGTNWIDSVLLEASYYYPDKLSFVNLSTKNPSLKLADGKIILVELKENSVDFKVSEEVKKKIIKVEGVNSSGKSIEQSSSSLNSMNSNYSIKFLNSLYEAGENTITKIDKKEYKNVDELVKDLYDMMPKTDDEKPENLVSASYGFRGNISSVNIFFEPTSAVNNYTFTLVNNAENVDGFMVAQNKKGLLGLLDESGKWVIDPTFERLSFYKGNYFMGDVADDGYRSIFWIDKTNKKLVPFKYRFYRTEAYFGKYYTIENGINGPKGIVDMNTNQILIEPVNDNIYLDGNFIIVRKTDNKQLLLDKDLKQIMVFNDQNFKVNDDFIFVDKPYTSKEKFADYTILSRTNDIYNKLGQKINKEDYVIDTYDSFGKDGLLLVKAKSGKEFYINTKGDVALETSKYAAVKNFSNGLAPVKNQAGSWGYMNTKGELVIPYLYNEAQTFSKTSAMVKTHNGYMLIDRNNKPIKKFAQGFSSYRTSKDSDTLQYTNYDGKTYGSDGLVIKK